MWPPAVFLPAFLGVFAAVWLIFVLRERSGFALHLRDIPAFETIRRAVAEAAEEGRPVHLSLGRAGIADANAMETIAALTTLDFLSQQAAVTLNTPLVTTANAAALLLAQDVMSKPFKDRDHLAQFDPLSVRFIGGGAGDGGAAYAAGVLELLDRREVAANFMLGHFGDEVLLAGEAAVRNDIPQVIGSASPDAMPFMLLSAEQVLVGEELFAAGAYLQRSPWHIGALAAQDTARWLIVLAVVAIAALRTLGML